MVKKNLKSKKIKIDSKLDYFPKNSQVQEVSNQSKSSYNNNNKVAKTI